MSDSAAPTAVCTSDPRLRRRCPRGPDGTRAKEPVLIALCPFVARRPASTGHAHPAMAATEPLI